MKNLSNSNHKIKNLWKNELKSALKSNQDLKDFFSLDFPKTNYKSFIPIKFAEKIKRAGKESALWKQYLPSSDEISPNGLIDPIGDSQCSIGNGLIHRYNNRVLFTPTTVCPIQCRFCFRKNELQFDKELFKTDIESIEHYLKNNKGINEIIFTGGDPLILPNEILESYLVLFTRLGIEFIRFHSKTPIHLPSRIDNDFLVLIKKYKFVFKRIILVIHCNHRDELDTEVSDALQKANESFHEILCQTVLLKDVNNTVNDLSTLINRLVDLNIRPYYLHHPDHVKGAQHFMVSTEEGKSLYKKLRQSISGWALPQYVLDSPSAQGKVNL